MDLGIIRGIGTVLLFLSFVALCAWVWAPAQRRRFEEAAALPFLDDDLSPQLKAGTATAGPVAAGTATAGTATAGTAMAGTAIASTAIASTVQTISGRLDPMPWGNAK